MSEPLLHLSFYFYFQGGVVLVSHDERLIRNVCNELWVVASKTVTSLEGGFDEYKNLVETELQEKGIWWLAHFSQSKRDVFRVLCQCKCDVVQAFLSQFVVYIVTEGQLWTNLL